MRNLMRAMILGTMIVSLLGCGKDDEGGKSSSSSSSVIGNSVGTVYQDFNTMKNAFTNSGFNAGVTANTVVYHVGPLYGGTQSNSSFSANASFCFFGNNLFGNDDKCNSDYYSNSILNNIIAKGEYKVIRSATATTVSYGVASYIDNGTFSYNEETFDVNDEIYRKMLNLDNKATLKIVVTQATIGLSNSGSIKGNFVEYFFQDGTYEAYIVSSALSKIANPVASYSGTYSVGSNNYNAQIQFTLGGRLYNTGQSKVISISAQYHKLVNDFSTGIPVVQPGDRIY